MQWIETTGQTYYWMSRQPVPPGTIVPGWTPTGLERYAQMADELLEKVRKEKYPNLPSRLGAVFVCDDLDCVRQWQRGVVHIVSVEGKTFKTYGNHLGHIAWALADKNMDRALDHANQYWQGELFWQDAHSGGLPEVIVQGKVTVLKLLSSEHP